MCCTRRPGVATTMLRVAAIFFSILTLLPPVKSPQDICRRKISVCVSVCVCVSVVVCVCVCVCACITHLMLTGNLDQRLVGLCCKFLCWGDDHCTNAVVARKQLAVQFLHKRHKKGKGLSRPGLGSTKHILSCQGVFQGCFLNPCWFHKSGACET